ncbi:type II toxin-antitoxin system VapC family toxin [Limnohabitans sp. JirII-31]|uniref:type II toxin-antitoxin system VapC family toxin n=1 Tax=Limnohabitans sp. JirII-31 TaxID=1977908 RepID=UPI000C1EE279|nr:type II toxin-antitoxin system VapC family toxin [Limnohabitans sp. JirII-31]PIT79978.1 VapC toxin family PIN domain ribonuclease [Limnohabitans sp. JirII-31]
MTALYLLDTNTVSHLIKRHPQVTQRLLAVPMHQVCISAITAGELAFGLAKRPEAVALKAAVDEFLRRVEVMPWDEAVAQTYGTLRAHLQSQGTPLAALDMQIAAHALHLNAILVSNDSAFAQATDLLVEDWTSHN